jgi:cytochrome c biogenesis protein CcdA
LLAAIALATVVFGAGALGLSLLVKAIHYRKTLHQVLLGAGLTVAGWLIMWFHLLVLNPRFLRYGALIGQPTTRNRQHSNDSRE